jgi:hypothetical protein
MLCGFAPFAREIFLATEQHSRLSRTFLRSD